MHRTRLPSLLSPLFFGLVLSACGSDRAAPPSNGGGTGGAGAQGGGAPGGAGTGGPSAGLGGGPAGSSAGGTTSGGSAGSAAAGARPGGAGSDAGGTGNGGANGGTTSDGGVTGDGGTLSVGGAGTSGTASGGAGNGGAGAGAAGSAGQAGGSSTAITVNPSEKLWTGVRYYTGTTPSNRTSGPMLGPSSTFHVHNGGGSMESISVATSGGDAARFEITDPAAFPVDLAAGADLDVTVRLVTDNARLGAAPAQDDGATVLKANLDVTGGAGAVAVRFYALVLTYVELEPTLGQILDAFPDWDSNVPAAIRNDANPNPGTLPGVEAGTDEVAAPKLVRADAGQPVSMIPIGRFSPAGEVPFGYHVPGNASSRTVVGTLARMTDPQTNDKARMLEPPLASGATTFDPGSAAFGIFMQPAGVGTLSSEDAEGFDGAHRVKIWKLRDGNGMLVQNAYLVGGEEASNGDYQDYVFVLTNVTLSP